MAEWPRDRYGRYLCTKEFPMYENRDQCGHRWVHEDVAETATDRDYYIEYRCKNCGIVFREEMPD